MHTGETWRLGRRPALDGLRGVAAVAVLAAHAGLPLLRSGGVGVDLFFALSGFLITSLLLEERRSAGRVRLGAFYGRRAVRLFPALLVTLVVAVPLGAAAADVGAVAAYGGNWVRAGGGDLGMLGNTWSLAIEEQFYLVWPVAVIAAGTLARRRSPAAVVLCLALAGAVGSALTRVLIWDGDNIARVYNGTDVRAENLLYGCALAALFTLVGDLAHVRLWVRRIFPVALVGLVATYMFEPQAGWAARWYVTVGYSLAALACAAVVGHLILSPGSLAATLLARRPLVMLGELSYAFYLWQGLVMYGLHRLGVAGLPMLALGFAASLAASVLSWHLIEQPTKGAVGGRFRSGDREVVEPHGVRCASVVV